MYGRNRQQIAEGSRNNAEPFRIAARRPHMREVERRSIQWKQDADREQIRTATITEADNEPSEPVSDEMLKLARAKA
jgi:hypothetical protein